MDFFELVSTGTPQDVQVAISNGADVNPQSNYGRIPLMNAAKWNPNLEVITTLLKAGTDAKAIDNYGYTVFDDAQKNAKLKGTDALQKLEEASK